MVGNVLRCVFAAVAGILVNRLARFMFIYTCVFYLNILVFLDEPFTDTSGSKSKFIPNGIATLVRDDIYNFNLIVQEQLMAIFGRLALVNIGVASDPNLIANLRAGSFRNIFDRGIELATLLMHAINRLASAKCQASVLMHRTLGQLDAAMLAGFHRSYILRTGICMCVRSAAFFAYFFCFGCCCGFHHHIVIADTLSGKCTDRAICQYQEAEEQG